MVKPSPRLLATRLLLEPRTSATELTSNCVWLLCRWIISISVIMMNKWILSYYGFRFPIALTMLHQSISALLAFTTIKVFRIVDAPELSR